MPKHWRDRPQDCDDRQLGALPSALEMTNRRSLPYQDKASNMQVVLIDFGFFAYSVQLTNALSELCRVTLMLPDKASDYYSQRVKRSVDLRRFHMPRLRYPTNLFMVHSLFKTITQIRPQVVHQLAWHPWMNLALPVFPKVPLVTTIHDVSRHPGDKESFVLFQDWQWRRAKRVIVHAKAMKRHLVDVHQVPEDKIHIIPHGSYDFYKVWASDQIAEQPNTILFFGRIWEYKGLQHLIEAEPLITSQVPDARIVIAGHGEPFEKYERLMVNRNHFIVHYRYIPDEMVARLFQEASIVALPYTEASQSGVLAIAFAFGKPVVATAVGGIPEVVEHEETGYLVPPRDSHSLAEAIVALLQDHDLRKKMGRKALEKAESELSWSSIARKTLQVYQKALAVR
jgi:glycosyltransferase involved in cell wall biosynthesis